MPLGLIESGHDDFFMKFNNFLVFLELQMH